MSDSEYSDSEYSDTSSEINDEGELICKNIDPALAKLMGVIVEESQTDWTPPKFSGLSNSERIIKDERSDIDRIIKKIENFETLEPSELEIMKITTHENKLKLIKAYNSIIQNIINTS